MRHNIYISGRMPWKIRLDRKYETPKLIVTPAERQLTQPMPLREPSTIFFQFDNVRRTIIASYWIIIILALPLWWKTTSIERLSLPSSRVRNQASKELRLPVQIQLPGSYLDATKRLQDQLAQRLSRQGVDAVFTGGGGWLLVFLVFSKRGASQTM